MAIALEKIILSLEEFLGLPETKPATEYIEGQIYQKPMPQGKHSTLQSEVITSINQIVKKKKIAYAFPELRCSFEDTSIVPDIAVMRWENIPFDPNREVANRVIMPPDWIIEILSPDQSALRVMTKISLAIINGSQLGWLICPERKLIMVCEGDQLPETKRGPDILPILDILSEWQVTVEEIFNLLTL